MLLKKSARLCGRGTDSKRCEKSAALAAADLFVFMHGEVQIHCSTLSYANIPYFLLIGCTDSSFKV